MNPLGTILGISNKNYKNMGPITDYRELLEVIKYNQEEHEQWYILVIVNPLNRTAAVDTFLENYDYLNDRTGKIQDMLFDRNGMLATVDWLEDNCPSYEYREGIDIILETEAAHLHVLQGH